MRQSRPHVSDAVAVVVVVAAAAGSTVYTGMIYPVVAAVVFAVSLVCSLVVVVIVTDVVVIVTDVAITATVAICFAITIAAGSAIVCPVLTNNRGACGFYKLSIFCTASFRASTACTEITGSVYVVLVGCRSVAGGDVLVGS